MADAPSKPKREWSQDDDFLKFKVLKRFRDRGLPMGQLYLDRIDYEGGVICQTGYAPYFLIVSDLTDFMRQAGIRFLVRGSGCGSAYVWGLHISHRWLDPIEYGIPFERFLNPERVSMPDLDIDIQDDKRHLVVEYTVNKYGKDNVARIISFGTLGAKAAIKDVARSLQLPDYQAVADRITAAIPLGKTTLKEAIEKSELLREMETQQPELFKAARLVEGYTRHTSVHAAGVVIAPSAMTNYVPLYFDGSAESRKTPEDWEPTTQWDMYDAEDRGMLKMDFLGLKTLRVIDESVQWINYIKENALGEKPEFDIDTIDRFDEATWRLLADGRLAGVFQVERQYVRNFAKRMNLLRRDPWDLAVLVAIIRPGMMDAGMTEVYLRRASGQEEAIPMHPLLAKTFQKTYGCMVFQEDVMACARDFAKFTMAKADILRKGVGKKMPEFIAKMYPDFEAGAIGQGAAKEDISRIWTNIEAHSRYSFNNAHAGAYGMVLTYQTAWLKARWPLVFMTCLINSESGVGNKEQGYNAKVAEYVEEARIMGLPVLPPCVKRSGPGCSIDWATQTIRFGLEMVKKAGRNAVAWIMRNCRQADCFKEFILACYEIQEVPYEAFRDKKGRDQPAGAQWKVYTRAGKQDVESLIFAGAFDVYDDDRERLLAMLEPLQQLAKKYWEQEAKIRNGSTRAMKPVDVKRLIDELTVSEETLQRQGLEHRLQLERAYTGCYLSESPFAPYRKIIGEYATCSAAVVKEGQYEDGESFKGGVFAGILRDFRAITVKNGKNKGREMAYLTWTGINGDVETVCFSDAWDQAHKKPGGVKRGKVYLVSVNLDRNGQSPIANDMTRLSNNGFAQAA